VAIELATAYVSLVPETSKLEKAVTDTFKGVGKQAEMAGREAGSRLAQTATKALKDGWRPDQDIMAGIPNTKLDRIGARMGQVIGKGVASGLKARQLGRDFTTSFSSGASSIGLGRIVSGWRSDLTGQSNKLGFLAGKALSAGLTAAVGVGVAGVTMALKTGFDRLVALDTAQFKLRRILQTSGRGEKDFERIDKAIRASVEDTQFSLDQAFSIGVAAIGNDVQDLERYMTSVANAAAFAGTEIGQMGLIFNQILSKGKLEGEETLQLLEAGTGLQAKSWIQKSYDLTSEQFEDMQRQGKITLDMLMKAVEDNAGGMAKALENTLAGSIAQMQTSLSRTGANFLAAIFGGEMGDETEGLKSAVQRITDMLNTLNAWIIANKDNIKEFFEAGKDAAETLLGVLGSVASVLKEHPKLIETVVVAFAAWKTIQFGGLLAALGDKKSGLGLLGKLGAILVVAETIEAVLNRINRTESVAVNAGPDFGSQAAMAAGGAAIGGKYGGIPGAIIGGAAGAAAAPALDIALGGGAAINGVLPGAPGGRPDTVGGIPIPGLGSGKPIGTAGQGYMNSRAAAAQLDRQLAPLTKALVKQKAAEFGLTLTSEFRNTPDWHGAGRAMDFSNSTGNTPQMEAFARYFADNYGTQLLELIYHSPTFSRNIKNGGPGAYGAQTLSQHMNHVHIAFDQGGILPPGTTLVENNTGKPELVLNPEQQQAVTDAGVDLGAVMHTGSGAPPGPQQPQQGEQAANLLRTMGFVPASAGNTGVAGTSSLAGFINMGNDIVGGVIDTGASLAQQAVSAGIMAGVAAGTFGGGAAAAPIADAAASYGIQLAANTAKRISAYGFQLAGIGADVLVEQLFPFGAPRWLGYDYTQFAPQLGIQQAALGSLEQMGSQAINQAMGPQPDQQQPPGQAEAAPSGPAQSSMMAEVQQPPTPPTLNLLPNLMGFDQGGMLPPGGLGINMTSRPEPVLTPQQWDAIASNSAIPMQGAPLVGNLYAQDMQGAIRELEKVKRRDMMQYAGRP